MFAGNRAGLQPNPTRDRDLLLLRPWRSPWRRSQPVQTRLNAPRLIDAFVRTIGTPLRASSRVQSNDGTGRSIFVEAGVDIVVLRPAAPRIMTNIMANIARGQTKKMIRTWRR